MAQTGISSAVIAGLGWAGKKPVVPAAPNVRAGEVEQEALANVYNNLPAIKDLAKSFSKFETNQLTKAWERLLPGFGAMTGQATDLAQSYMKGEIPADVMKSIQDATAAAAAGRGTTGSTFQFADTARSLGLTSLDLSKIGTGIYGNLANMFMPYAPMRGFTAGMMPTIAPMTVPQTASLNQWNETQRFNTEMMHNVLAAMPSPQQQMFSQAFNEFDALVLQAAATYFGGPMAGAAMGAPNSASSGASSGWDWNNSLSLARENNGAGTSGIPLYTP